MRYSRTQSAPPEPTWSWRTKVIGGVISVAAIFIIVTAYFMIKNQREPIESRGEPAKQEWIKPTVEYIPPPPPKTTTEETIFATPQQSQPARQSGNTQTPDDPFKTAKSDPIKVYSANSQEIDGTTFPGGSMGTGCRLPAGTVVQALLESATTNTNPGAVIARVTRDVLGEEGCDGIRMGAIMVGSVEQGASFHSERSNAVFKTIEQEGRPPIDLEAAAADAMGKGGIPGDVDHHTGLIATRVAIATITGIMDSAASSVLGIYGGIGARETSRAVDKWAEQAINLAPTLTNDPSKRRVPITIIFEKSVML